jgi:hypothetical protein
VEAIAVAEVAVEVEAVAVEAEEEGSMPFISFEEVFLLPLSETFEMTSSNSLEI